MMKIRQTNPSGEQFDYDAPEDRPLTIILAQTKLVGANVKSVSLEASDGRVWKYERVPE